MFGRPSAGGGGGGGNQQGGGGRRSRGAGAGVYALGAAVVAAPAAALYIKAQNDEEGLRETLDSAGVSPSVTDGILVLVGSGRTPPAAPAPPKKAPSNTGAPAERKEVLKQPSAAEKQLVEERRRHEEALKAAVAAATAKSEAEAQAEMERIRELEERLSKRMAKLEEERFNLKAENEALRQSQDQRPPPPAQPQIIFQEMRLTDELKERADEVAAQRTAERVVGMLRADDGGGENATRSYRSGAMVDPSKEEALKPDTSLEQAQQRVVELLEELDARTRLEGVRLREAVNQARQQAGEGLMVAAAQQLAAQERELQLAMDKQVKGIRDAAVKAIIERDAMYDSRARAEWPILNERAQAFAGNTIRMQQLRRELEGEAELQKARAELQEKISAAEEERANALEEQSGLIGKVKEAMEVQGSASQTSLRLHNLSMVVLSAMHALEVKAPFKDELSILKAAGVHDELVRTAVAAIPSGAAAQGVSTPADLHERYEWACDEARRRLLVPEGGGMISEFVGSMRAKLLPRFTDKELPPRTNKPDDLLRRAHYFVKKGDLRGALEELAQLEGRPAQAVSGWVESARHRLVVMQSLKLLQAHVSAESVTVDAAVP